VLSLKVLGVVLLWLLVATAYVWTANGLVEDWEDVSTLEIDRNGDARHINITVAEDFHYCGSRSLKIEVQHLGERFSEAEVILFVDLSENYTYCTLMVFPLTYYPNSSGINFVVYFGFVKSRADGGCSNLGVALYYGEKYEGAYLNLTHYDGDILKGGQLIYRAGSLPDLNIWTKITIDLTKYAVIRQFFADPEFPIGHTLWRVHIGAIVNGMAREAEFRVDVIAFLIPPIPGPDTWGKRTSCRGSGRTFAC